MASVHREAQEARRLRGSQKHEAAMRLLEEALRLEPGHPDLLAERGLLLCLYQREDEALEALEKAQSSSLAPELFRWLEEYIHCRTDMAGKMGIEDAKGKALAKRLAKLDPTPPKKSKRAKPGISLSACLIVRNEEKHLERCLSSLRGHVDEIVVVDTGSTDRTVEIALAHGAKVAEFAWCDDFSAARNVSLELASGDWALWIDADEEVDPESWGAIREGLIRPHFGGYFVRIVNYMDETGSANTYTHAPVRLFRLLPEVRFQGRVHEQVTPALDKLGLPCAQLGGATFHHYGYRPSDMAEKGKLERTISLLEEEVRAHPEDAFHWFNLANTYSVARRWEDAVHAARMCLRTIHPENAFGTLAYQILASGLNALGKPHEALESCSEAERKGFFSILNQFEKAHALLKLARLEEALQAIEACMDMPWDETMTGDYGIVTHKARTLRGQILSEMGLFEEALAELDEALGVDPAFPVALYGKARTLERMGDTGAAAVLYESLYDDPQFDYPARDGTLRIAVAQGKWEEAICLGERLCRSHPMQLSGWAGYLGALEAQGDPSARQAGYQHFAEFHDLAADVLVNWSRSLRECGEVEAAYAKLTEAIEREPGNSNAHFNLGDLLYSCGLYADAAASYEAGLKIEPQSAEGWFVLGNCFAQLEVWEGARLAYLQALELKPNYHEAKHNLAWVDESSQAA
jgi:tetratricopeptide (TPR) repeat protein